MALGFIKNIFKSKPPERIRLTKENVRNWPSFLKLLDSEKIRFDGEGRLRYLHGAPVGDLVLVRINKDGKPKYKESAEECFDPESAMAKRFVWP